MFNNMKMTTPALVSQTYGPLRAAQNDRPGYKQKRNDFEAILRRSKSQSGSPVVIFRVDVRVDLY